MKIASSRVYRDEKSFEPIVEVVLLFPLELMVDGRALMGDEELACLVGKEFLSAWDTHKSHRG